MTFVSYAQSYEDVRLWRALGEIEGGCYLDVGAQHPVMDSVSKAFYDAGWRGAHVEPTSFYAAALRKNRPDERVFEMAVGNPGAITFYEFPDTGMSTGVAEIARAHSEAGFEVRLRQVPVVPLSKILADFGEETIHWMKIDVEGMEADVIGSWGKSPVKPWVLVIESVHPSTHDPMEGGWLDLVLSRGYREAAFDGLSRYFVAEEHSDLASALATPPHIFDDFRITSYHFSAQAVVAESSEQLSSARAETAELRASLDQLGRSEADLKAAKAEIAVSNDALAAAESELAAARSDIGVRDEALRAGEAQLAAARAELGQKGEALRIGEAQIAATRAEISQMLIALEAAEEKLADTAARQRESDARAESLRRALLADYAEARRSRDEMQQALEDLRAHQSSTQAAALNAIDARIAAVEEENHHRSQNLETIPPEDLTSSHESVEAVAGLSAGSAEAAMNHLTINEGPEFAPMTLDDLLEFYDEQFVTRAYQLLLGREADPAGLRFYTRRLRRGVSRIRVLSDLAGSHEGRNVGAQLPGLRKAIRKERIRDLISLRSLGARLLGGDQDALSRMRAMENRLATLNTFSSSVFQHANGVVPARPPVQPVPLVPEPKPTHAQAPATSATVALDADRMLSAEQWPVVTEDMFELHWPNHGDRLKNSRVDAARHLWIVVAGEASATLPPQTVANLRSLRDAAPFEVEFGSLGPRMPLNATTYASINDLSRAVPADGLVMFVGPTDRVDVRLPTALILEDAWNRDFILTDQSYEDKGRVAPIPFHAIDHYHLAHVDYFWSRFMVSGRALRQAADAGAKSLLEVSRRVVDSLRSKPGRLLHLQFPFISNGALELSTVRASRHSIMQDLAAVPTTADRGWDNSVSVIISTKDGGYLLDGLVHQLLAMPRIAEVLIVSNNSSGDYTLDVLDRLSQADRCAVFKYDRPFNFSVQTNIAASQAKGRFLMLLNDDVSLIGPDWLEHLLSDVDTETPRVAGPLMLYPNQSIQHGGMYLGHNDRAGHTYRHQRHPHDAPMYELVAPRLVSCITGACLLMKRSLYEELNGLDEQLATGLQDVDFCLRAMYGGAELVFDPRAIIFHLESVSLNPTLADESVQRRRDREYARFRERWHSKLRPDRWHNENFYIEDEALRHLRIAQ